MVNLPRTITLLFGKLKQHNGEKWIKLCKLSLVHLKVVIGQPLIDGNSCWTCETWSFLWRERIHGPRDVIFLSLNCNHAYTETTYLSPTSSQNVFLNSFPVPCIGSGSTSFVLASKLLLSTSTLGDELKVASIEFPFKTWHIPASVRDALKSYSPDRSMLVKWGTWKHTIYRVTNQVVPNLPLMPTQRLCFSKWASY